MVLTNARFRPAITGPKRFTNVLHVFCAVFRSFSCHDVLRFVARQTCQCQVAVQLFCRVNKEAVEHRLRILNLAAGETRHRRCQRRSFPPIDSSAANCAECWRNAQVSRNPSRPSRGSLTCLCNGICCVCCGCFPSSGRQCPPKPLLPAALDSPRTKSQTRCASVAISCRISVSCSVIT